MEDSTSEVKQMVKAYANDVANRKKINVITSNSFIQVGRSICDTNNYCEMPQDVSHISTNKGQQTSTSDSDTQFPPSYTRTSTPVVNNPYKKKEGGNVISTDQEKSEHCNGYFGSDGIRSLLAQQHPHRAGRIRRDWQFGTNLDINTMDNDDDKNHPSPSRPQRHEEPKCYLGEISKHICLPYSLSSEDNNNPHL